MSYERRCWSSSLARLIFYQVIYTKKLITTTVSKSSRVLEMAVIDTVKNFIVSLTHLGIIGSEENKDGRLIFYLCDDFNNESNLDVALNNVLSFYTF